MIDVKHVNYIMIQMNFFIKAKLLMALLLLFNDQPFPKSA